jgi:Cd2+/Zn2+-exporting ATPase
MSPSDACSAGAAGGADTHLPAPEDAAGCLEILSGRLRENPGVSAVEVDFNESTLTVRYEPTRITPEDLNALAEEVGAVFSQRVTYCERRTSLGSCDECALRLGHVPPEHAGEYSVTVERGRVGLARSGHAFGQAELRRPLGQSKPWGRTFTPAEEEAWSRGRGMAALTAACLVLLLVGAAMERAGLPTRWHHWAYLLSALAGGWFALRSSLTALVRLRFDVNLLMLLAAVGAGTIGYIFEAAVLMFLFSLSNTLEVYTMGRTRRALHALLKLRPARARVRREGKEHEVAAEDVRVGEIVVVLPGEGLPVDGVVARGESLVDQSSLTGESVPVAKHPGESVYAGTLNQEGSLEVRTTRAAGDTTLARIVLLVQEAQEAKSRTEELAQWVGRYYTIVVLVAAVAMVFVPPFLLRQDFTHSFYRAMTLLVVASPCALVIATPATILSAIANAARQGVLFKGGRHIEALARVRAIAFDKTGTLTHGRFEVTDVIGLDGASEPEVLEWAASAERRSQHPIAHAVVSAANRRGVRIRPADALTSYPGRGLVARLDGESITVGALSLFEHLGQSPPTSAVEAVRRLNDEGKTAVVVARAGRWGVIAAADRLRPVAREVVAQLRRLGIRNIGVLSGDSRHTVSVISSQAGADEQFAELLPEDKVNKVAELERRHGAVAMVGDGVNDAPALARSTVGVVMGGIGSDAALESADIVLMADDLTALPYAVSLAQRARRAVLQNVVIASGVMVVLVVLVFAGGHLPAPLPGWMISADGNLRLPFAVSGHEGSTVAVILNGLRLLGTRRV